MDAGIFGMDEFSDDLDCVLSLMPRNTAEEKMNYDYMSGIAGKIVKSKLDPEEITKLLTYLDEKDRRRNTNWEVLFPWLTEYKKYVV